MRELVLIMLAFCIGFIFGAKNNQTEIERRALTINKECYTGTDLGFIIKRVKQP